MGQIRKRHYKIVLRKSEQKGHFKATGTDDRIFGKFTMSTNILTSITVLKTNIAAEFVLKQASYHKHMEKWRNNSTHS
jgi:hypothetical protein